MGKHRKESDRRLEQYENEVTIYHNKFYQRRNQFW